MANTSKPTPTITPKDTKHIANLLHVPLNDEEIETLTPQLSQAAEYVQVLQELDLSGIQETNQVTGLKNVFREDMITPSLSQEEALRNAKNTYDGYFVVPATIAKE